MKLNTRQKDLHKEKSLCLKLLAALCYEPGLSISYVCDQAQLIWDTIEERNPPNEKTE